MADKGSVHEIVGIVFPFLPLHVPRFFENGKTVFVKFFGKETVPLRLRSGHKLFFYESGGRKVIVGEATIAQVTGERADQVFTRFGEDELFLGRSELQDYIGDRGTRRVLVLVVKDAKSYTIPLRLKKSVTMAGCYMTKKMYDDLTARAGEPSN